MILTDAVVIDVATPPAGDQTIVAVESVVVPVIVNEVIVLMMVSLYARVELTNVGTSTPDDGTNEDNVAILDLRRVMVAV